MNDGITTQKWSTLVDRLVQQTEAGKLKWKTSVDEDTIIVGVSNHHLGITRKGNRHSAAAYDYVLEIYNSDSKVVDQFSDEMVPNSYHKFDRLYASAFRQANGSDAVLEEILTSLSDDDELPI